MNYVQLSGLAESSPNYQIIICCMYTLLRPMLKLLRSS